MAFKSIDRDTQFLFPPSVQDWLPEGHLARFVVDIVSQLDLRVLNASYKENGEAAYPPSMLLSLLFYGYATGTFSSRSLERKTYDSIDFRYIAANTHPDHSTISWFRKKFLKELSPLFLQILSIAAESGLLKLGTVSLDGTKMKANASRHKAMSYKYACELEKKLKLEVKRLMKLAESADESDIPDGMNLPEELKIREARLSKIAEAKAEIERRAAERYEFEKNEYEEKLAEREKKARKKGRKPGGKPPQPPTAGPGEKDQMNFTDPESRIMPKSGGGFEQAYNAQASVDTDSRLIVGEHVSQKANDKQELEPALLELDKLPDAAGRAEKLNADNGYYSETNVKACEREKIEPYIAMGREPHNQDVMDRFAAPGPTPAEGASAVERMGHRLKTPEGRRTYSLRKQVVEPVFGIIKSAMGFKQFMLRGLEKVSGEWTLVCLAYNLKRMHIMSQKS
ncbi:IS1182 family transposase [Deltaproteobacteria bacterium OttesenSCG-928-M10]|nr:IS1182 family transposase [Deltaproteobacteria bacterium OttesenSCG-928-M10]